MGELKTKKKGNKILYWGVVILGTTFIVASSYNIGYKLGGAVEGNSSKTTVKEEKSNKNKVKEVDIKSKLGVWYLEEKEVSYPNPQTLTIKNYENNQLLVDLYFTRVADFDNVVVSMDGNKGTFKATTENGVSLDSNQAEISGTIEVSEKSVILNITSSNVEGIPEKSTTYKHQMANSNIDAYKGVWYENETEVQASNPTTINLKSIKGNKVVFDSYIRRTVDLKDVTVYISDNNGTFKIEVMDATTTDGNPGFVEGYIAFNDNTVSLSITMTNIINLENGTTITFTYKK